MKIKAVIFDRDGVLTDFDLEPAATYFAPLLPWSLNELIKRWRAYGLQEGFPGSLEEEQRFFRGFWSSVADELNLSAERYARLVEFDYTRCIRAWPDAHQALCEARDAGLFVGVLSNFSLASLDHSLAAVGLADLVDVACAATVIGHMKPDAAAYLAVAHALNVQPHECLFFDDEVSCVEGAHAVGMHAFHVDRSRVQHDLAQHVVCDLSAVGQLIKMQN